MKSFKSYHMMFLLAVVVVSFAKTAIAKPTTVLLQIGNEYVAAEVASKPEELVRGLQNRTFMPPQSSMLFLFPTTDKHCMWMKNTKIPLLIAFIASDGTIISIKDAKPETKELYCSDKNVRYAIEIEKNSFSEKTIQVGSKISMK